jgi:hypothetical protein
MDSRFRGNDSRDQDRSVAPNFIAALTIFCARASISASVKVAPGLLTFL